MNLPLRMEAEASREAELAAFWYEDRRAGLGMEFLEALDTTLQHISEWPDAGSPVPLVNPELSVRQVPIPRFPYRVIYLTTRETIRVLAVAHSRRLPGFWRGRV